MVTVILGMSRVSPKYQVTIPKDVREAFEIRVGNRILFLREDGKLVLKTS